MTLQPLQRLRAKTKRTVAILPWQSLLRERGTRREDGGKVFVPDKFYKADYLLQDFGGLEVKLLTQSKALTVFLKFGSRNAVRHDVGTKSAGEKTL